MEDENKTRREDEPTPQMSEDTDLFPTVGEKTEENVPSPDTDAPEEAVPTDDAPAFSSKEDTESGDTPEETTAVETMVAVIMEIMKDKHNRD